MNQRYEVVTGPATEPVELADCKAHLKVEVSDDDDLISELITAVRQDIEAWLNRKLITQTVRISMDRFEWQIPVRVTPVQSISSIEYTDPDGNTQAVGSGNYQVDLVSPICRIRPNPDFSWPSTRASTMNAVRITYLAGYGDASADVPSPIRVAIKRRVATYYENRQDELVGRGLNAVPLDVTSRRLLAKYRIGHFG